MRNWELARAQRTDAESPPVESVHPFVSISRTAGAGGNETARLLSARLGWPLFDKELLQAMSGDDAVRERFYRGMDERDVGWLEEMLRGWRFTEQTRNDYFHRLTETVLAIARGQNAIFLGRGTDAILPSDRGTRVRIVAPLDTRARRFAQLRGVSLEQAREDVRTLDTERAAFIERYFRRQAGDPSRYDLVINSEHLSPDQMTSLIVCVMRYRNLIQ